MEGTKHLSADRRKRRHSAVQNIAPRAATRWRRAAAGGAQPARPRPSPLPWQRSRAARSRPGTVAMRAASGQQPAGEAEETGSDGRGEAARGGQPCERGDPRLASLRAAPGQPLPCPFPASGSPPRLSGHHGGGLRLLPQGSCPVMGPQKALEGGDGEGKRRIPPQAASVVASCRAAPLGAAFF